MQRQICKSMVLYKSTPQAPLDIRTYFNLSLELLDTIGYKPNYIGIIGKGYSRKLTKFATGLKKMESQDFDNIESIDLIYSPTDSPAYDWLFSCSLDLSDGIEAFLAGTDDLLSDTYFVSALKNISAIINIEYGYVFYREFDKGPEFYVGGAIQGAISEREEKAITKWFHDTLNKKSYSQGKLRDVYDLNIITDNHLNYKLTNELYLKDLIGNHAGSRLEEVNSQLYLWIVSPSSIMDLRMELSKYDVLISFDDSVTPTYSIY